MFAHIRAFAKSPFAVGLIGLLLISFAVFGISDVFRNQMVKDAVVQAGSRTIKAAEFKQAFDSNRKRYEQQSGQTITAEQAVAAGLDKQLANSMADNQSFAEMLNRLDVKASPKLIASELAKIPTFHDPVSGRFDKKAYQGWLQQQGITAEMLETEFGDNIAQTHFISGLLAGMQAPRLYGAIGATYNREGRTFTWFQVNPAAGGKPPEPTDDQLNAYIKANAARFTRPEMRELTVVHYSAAEIAKALPLNPAEVQKRFDFEKDSLSTPEKRTVVQIPIRDAAKAGDALARLQKGEDPNAVAKSLGVQPALYTDAPKSAISDRKVADAAFGLKEGESAGPIAGSLGTAIIKVTKITPGHAVTLADPAVRQKVEDEVRKEAATQKVYDLVQKYQDTHAGGGTLAEVSKKLGLTPVTLPATDKEGKALNGQPVGLPSGDPKQPIIPIPPKTLEAAFALPQGGETDMEEGASGEYYAVRADKVLPQAPVTLAEAKAAVMNQYIREELIKRATAKANELAVRIRKGEAMATVAAGGVGGPVRTTADIHRSDGEGKPFGREFVGALFAAKKGEVITAFDQQLGFIVAKLDDVGLGPTVDLARAAEAQRQPLAQAILRDLSEAVRLAARDQIKPKVDDKLARSALGVDADAVPAPAGGAGK